MDWLTWYQGLAKPSWTPAPATIGLIWNVLYAIILVTFGYVFIETVRGRIKPRTALPFAINLVANLIFSPIMFYARSLPAAAVDILVVWSTIIWIAVAIWPYARWVSIAQIPYFVWVSIATVIQLSITWGNQ